MDRLRKLGMSGIRRRKENPSECLVQSGHAEIEGNNLLFIYGNAFEILSEQKFQEEVEQISCQFAKFDYIY